MRTHARLISRGRETAKKAADIGSNLAPDRTGGAASALHNLWREHLVLSNLRQVVPSGLAARILERV